MRKVIFAINTTADGGCDHRDGIADSELHEFFTVVYNIFRTLKTSRV